MRLSCRVSLEKIFRPMRIADRRGHSEKTEILLSKEPNRQMFRAFVLAAVFDLAETLGMPAWELVRKVEARLD